MYLLGKGFLIKKKCFYVKIIFYTAYFSYLKCCIESMVNTVKMYQRSHSKINTCFCSDVFLRKKHHLIFGTIRYCRHNKMNSMLMLYHELSANEMLLNGGGAVLASVCLSNASSHIMWMGLNGVWHGKCVCLWGHWFSSAWGVFVPCGCEKEVDPCREAKCPHNVMLMNANVTSDYLPPPKCLNPLECYLVLLEK